MSLIKEVTKELREWAEGDALRAGMSLNKARSQVLAIADRIDAEHERQLEVLYHDMSDAEYVKLPVDADGEYIHIGDVMDSSFYEDGTVVGIEFYEDGRVLIAVKPHGWDTATWQDPESYRHHHAPTVEDVLAEFADKWISVQPCREPEIIAEYAAKLRGMLDGDPE